MDQYKLSFIIKSDADPSQLLDILEEMAERFPGEVESYGAKCELREGHHMVEDIS